MAALECLQDAGFSDQYQLQANCAQAVWEYKVVYMRLIQVSPFIGFTDPRSTLHRRCQPVLYSGNQRDSGNGRVHKRYSIRVCLVVCHGFRTQDQARLQVFPVFGPH